ncbi:hypothetical protein ACFL6M_06915, partial [Candidatus Eisenbacteria bacterium]
LNVITNVNRVTGELPMQDRMSPFDRIVVGFDINTFQGNVDTRFNPEAIAEFYPKAVNLRTELFSQVKELVDE